MLIIILIFAFLSGITIFVGGLIAHLDKSPDSEVKEEILHGTVAFGGGILISAVAFVLTPRGIESQNLAVIIITFASGALTFLLLDRFLERKGGSLAQLLAMIMDYIPEAIALGAICATEHRIAILLAIFIGMQNLPEGFNSYRDLIKSNWSPGKALSLLIPLSFMGLIAASAGYFLLKNHQGIIDILMLFSASGIIYLTFQDIAPLAKMEKQWTPALGASMGFLVGMIGTKIIG